MRFFRGEIFGGDDETAAAAAGDQVFGVFGKHEDVDDVVGVCHVQHHANGLTIAAAARQIAGAQRVAAAIGGHQDEPVGGLAGEQRAELVAFLEFLRVAIDDVAAHGAYPAFFRQHHGNRLTLDGDDVGDIDGGRDGAEFGAPCAERAGRRIFSGFHRSRR